MILVFRPLKPRRATSAPARRTSSSERSGSKPAPLAAATSQCVEEGERSEAGPLLDAAGVADAPGAAMRPVKLQPVTDRTTEHLVDRDAQGLGLQIHQRVLDCGDRLVCYPAHRLTRDAVQVGGDL